MRFCRMTAAALAWFRSEFLYLQGSDYPTEDEQFEAYKTVAERMGGRRVIIRTLDIGAGPSRRTISTSIKKKIPAMGCVPSASA